jgi:hypothetical protein
MIEDEDLANESNNNFDGTTSVVTTADDPPKPIPIVGFVTLELLDTPDLLDSTRRDAFVDITEAFLSFNIFFSQETFDVIEISSVDGKNNITTTTTYMTPLLDDEGIMVEMTRQSRTLLFNDENYRRQLQEEQEDIFSTSTSTFRPLYVTLQVTGIANEPNGGSSDVTTTTVFNESTNTTTEALQLPDLELFNFNEMLQQIFIEKQFEYVEALQITGDDYFNQVDQVNVLLDSTILGPGPDEEGTINPDKDSIGNNNRDEPTVPSDNEEQSTSPLSMEAIIGIAVGGGVFVLCCFGGLLYFCCCRSNKKGQEVGGTGSKASATGGVDALEKPSIAGPTTTPQSNKKKPWSRGRRNRNNTTGIDGPVDSMAEQHLISTDNSSNKPDDEDEEVASSVDLGNDTDLESQAMYSYNPRGDSGSLYTASNSIMMSGGGAYPSSNQSYYNDNMSYAYSLEPGIEASVIDGVNTTMSQHGSRTMMVDDSVRSRVPIREIPQISTGNGGGTSSGTTPKHNSVLSPSSTRSDGFGNTKIETSASDLKLTESELAMLPSNLRSADEDDETSPADTSEFTSTNTNYVTRKVSAPSGKLGIVIDTTVEGPVVHNVNKGSRLTGKIFSGDIIIAIDDVDTRAMSASAITALMVKTANQQRTLTVRTSSKSER